MREPGSAAVPTPRCGAPSARRAALADRFDPRRNALNAIRLALAVVVIVSHTWVLGGYGDEPQLGGANLGAWAVLGFFGLSGFLITGSRLRTSAGRYYLARALRIVPGFAVCLVVTAFVVAPVIAVLGTGGWDAASAATYVVRNAALYPYAPPGLVQPSIGAVLSGAPYPALNGSLWTLFWEAGCYLLVGVGVSLLPRRLLTPAVVAAFGATTALAAVLHALGQPGPAVLERPLQMVSAFMAGAVLLLLSHRLPLGAASGVSAVVLAGVVITGTAGPLAALPLTLLLLAASVVLPLARVGARRDLSYGVYVYGFAVQQLLVAAGLHRHVPPLVFVLVALVVVTPVAWASFVVVEAPAMRLARRGPVGRTAAAQPLVVDLREPALPVAVRTPQRER
ncbi:acyltransferase family protein [Quadrisphaera oryzae]|uniref:acyltransferase family protein n=1 Tax=Quadrisphaera TaxID=317661 RepID=UPI001645ABAA|nr:acyltransferase [Quadrisphaera sp. RL12-1S]MBC3762756.1 acyltransferase [Quadrisphaera sp. RL12-1S]